MLQELEALMPLTAPNRLQVQQELELINLKKVDGRQQLQQQDCGRDT